MSSISANIFVNRFFDDNQKEDSFVQHYVTPLIIVLHNTYFSLKKNL